MNAFIELMITIGVVGIIGLMLVFGLSGRKKVTCGDDCNCDCD
tara:strand:+ start:76 stop:204 length:129 start_codon:yes stop_codon:yes gene_type:complete